jgi:tryptophanyl-tRNA synthetase
VFEIWSLFAERDERAEMFERARAGGLGYGDVKKDLLRRLLSYFAPMRERRADLEKHPDDVESVLLDGASRAREIGAPILDEVRQAAGFRPRN